MTKSYRGTNYGIQAENVQAKNLAVGKNARATYLERESPEVAEALRDLREAIDDLGLPDTARALLTSDLDAIEEEAETGEPKSDRVGRPLKAFVEKLKMVGAIAEEGANLIEPIKKIAAATGVALAVLGL